MVSMVKYSELKENALLFSCALSIIDSEINVDKEFLFKKIMTETRGSINPTTVHYFVEDLYS
jgi:hypothetical protein